METSEETNDTVQQAEVQKHGCLIPYNISYQLEKKIIAITRHLTFQPSGKKPERNGPSWRWLTQGAVEMKPSRDDSGRWYKVKGNSSRNSVKLRVLGGAASRIKALLLFFFPLPKSLYISYKFSLLANTQK